MSQLMCVEIVEGLRSGREEVCRRARASHVMVTVVDLKSPDYRFLVEMDVNYQPIPLRLTDQAIGARYLA